MELIRHSYNLKSRHRGCVATIGNYDGVHLGHQAVLRQLKRHAEIMELPATVITFEPHPQEFFSEVQAPTRLTSFREKLEMLKQQDIDRVLCLRFQRAIADLTAERFIRQILARDLGIKRLIIGDDFRFGKGREGDVRMLRAYGGELGFDVIPTEARLLDGARVSSSSIRERLGNSQFEEAQSLLGRYFSISGRVAHGAKRGRKLGFPTANINLGKRVVPLRGVFAVSVKGADEFIHLGVANLGTRPVFDEKKLLLEAHLFDFDKEFYGKHISVEFFKRLRDEQKFSSIDELTAQIAADIKAARAFFANASRPRAAGGE